MVQFIWVMSASKKHDSAKSEGEKRKGGGGGEREISLPLCTGLYRTPSGWCKRREMHSNYP